MVLVLSLPYFAQRIESPEQLDQAWLGVFERIKKSSRRPSPP